MPGIDLSGAKIWRSMRVFSWGQPDECKALMQVKREEDHAVIIAPYLQEMLYNLITLI